MRGGVAHWQGDWQSTMCLDDWNDTVIIVTSELITIIILYAIWRCGICFMLLLLS